ncbi:MAG: mandelate racemase [Dehalococcoidales bacterium]|nr:mandelate racemase [Dehalococcoidales bacterium]
MNIARVEVIPLSVPIDYPFRNPRFGLSEKLTVAIAKVTTDDGLDAFGVTFTWVAGHIKSLVASIDDLGATIIGQDVMRPAEAWQKIYAATIHMGHSGHSLYALSALDSAIWVLKAKALNQPLYQLLGGYRDKVPAYASYLLWRDWPIDRLQKDAAMFKEQGFKYIKMKLGGKTLADEVTRFKAVREAVGNDVNIMVDGNWAWNVPEAIRFGRELEKMGAFWLEDPLASEDPDQMAELSRSLDIPVATGETFNTKYDFRRLIEKRSAYYYIADLQRVGGITEWMKVAVMLEAWNLPISSHLFPDFSVHLLAAAPNGFILEYMPWWDKIYTEPHKVVDGFMEAPKTPGLGLELDPAALKKWRL